MLLEVKIPSVGESVTEAILAQWYKSDGDMVKKDEPLFVIETDKVTLEVVAEADGIIAITVAEGQTVPIGSVVGTIDTEAAPKAGQTTAADKAAADKEPAPGPGDAHKPEAAEAEPPTPQPVTVP